MTVYRRYRMDDGRWVTIHMSEYHGELFDYMKDAQVKSEGHRTIFCEFAMRLLGVSRKQKAAVKESQLTFF